MGMWGVMGMMNVSMMTMMESKLLSYLQSSYGPKSYMLQAMMDGMKMMMKESMYMKDMKYYMSSMYSMMMSMMMWEMLPMNYKYNEMNMNYTMMLFMLLSSLNMYPMMYGGMGSNNKYTMLSMMSGMNQLMSYEMNMTMTMISIIYLSKSFNLHDIYLSNLDNMIFIPIFLMLFMSLLAESYSLPFDFLEGESEMVGGSITEYASMEFTLMYMTEYFMMMMNNYFFFLLFFNPLSSSFFLLFILFYIWISGLLPSYKYNDMLMMNWSDFMPLSFSFLLLLSLF